MDNLDNTRNDSGYLEFIVEVIENASLSDDLDAATLDGYKSSHLVHTTNLIDLLGNLPNNAPTNRTNDLYTQSDQYGIKRLTALKSGMFYNNQQNALGFHWVITQTDGTPIDEFYDYTTNTKSVFIPRKYGSYIKIKVRSIYQDGFGVFTDWAILDQPTEAFMGGSVYLEIEDRQKKVIVYKGLSSLLSRDGVVNSELSIPRFDKDIHKLLQEGREYHLQLVKETSLGRKLIKTATHVFKDNTYFTPIHFSDVNIKDGFIAGPSSSTKVDNPIDSIYYGLGVKRNESNTADIPSYLIDGSQIEIHAPRSSVKCSVEYHQSQLLVMGGYDTGAENNIYDKAYAYDTTPGASQIQSGEWNITPRAESCSAVNTHGFDTDIYMIGGVITGGDVSGVVEALNIDYNVVFTRESLPVPVKNAGCYTVGHNKLLVSGGVNNNGIPVDILQLYDANTDSWRILDIRLPNPVHSHAHFSVLDSNLNASEIIIAGGRNMLHHESDDYHYDNTLTDVYKLNFITGDLMYLDSLPANIRDFSYTQIFNDYFIFGGEVDGLQSTTAVNSLQSTIWGCIDE